MNKHILITGGAGFIGSNLIQLLLELHPNYHYVIYDKLTYAGNLNYIKNVLKSEQVDFIQADICDQKTLEQIIQQFSIDSVIHLAAETHNDRSIDNPTPFGHTNVIGTLTLLNTLKKYWADNTADKLFLHISTDEVYGSIPYPHRVKEGSPYNPQSPYSASKAASDHFVQAFGNTYRFPYIISYCTNNFGPHQFPEKLIPLIIDHLIKDQDLPIYGTGLQIRDWIYVKDHCYALDKIFHHGKKMACYHISSNNEITNLETVHLICNIIDKKLNRTPSYSKSKITHIPDRQGHDFRYALNHEKLSQELNWNPLFNFEKALEQTIDWYLNQIK